MQTTPNSTSNAPPSSLGSGAGPNSGELDPVSVIGKPSWTVSSTITKNNYHISQNDLVFPQLIKVISDKGCALVQGSYRSGKSSHCEALEAFLNAQPNCYCLRIELSIVDMKPGQSFSNLSHKIFNSVMESLRNLLPPSYDMTQFSIQGALRKIKASVPTKRMYLLWDEFQLLVEPGAEEIRAEITEACRLLVHTAEVIYSCLVFGTFNLQFLDPLDPQVTSNPQVTPTPQVTPNPQFTPWNLSPFDLKPVIYMAKASCDNMRKTILQWISDRGENFDTDVIDAWIQVCGGFLGVFSYIGYMLTLRDPSQGLTYSGWTVEYARILRDMLRGQGTFSRVINSVLCSSSTCKEMIRINMLADLPIHMDYSSAHYVDLMNMASTGVFTREVVSDRKDKFVVSCPTIRHLVLNLFSAPSPLMPDILFDPMNHKQLVSRFLTQLANERHILTQKLCWTEKGFPSEATFQALMFSDAKQAFAQDPIKINYIVLMETGQRIKSATTNKKPKIDKKPTSSEPPKPAVTKKRSDLLIINGHKVIIELKSNGLFTGVRTASNKSSADKLSKAIHQVVHYAKAQEIDNGILLNIVAHNSPEGSLLPQYEQDGVTVHVHQARFAQDFSSWEWIAPS